VTTKMLNNKASAIEEFLWKCETIT